jgi:site-specific DNA recombinase
MPIAAVYCRVSTEDQRDEGTSLETQREAGILEARATGNQVEDRFIVEEDWTGTDLTRPGLSRVLRWIENGDVQAVVFYTFDRLYRPENEGDEWRVFPVIQSILQAGAEIIWVDKSIPVNGPMAPVIMSLISWKSGDERRRILARTRAGRLQTARRGGLLGGFVPYGYHYLPKTSHSLATLETAEHQALVVRQMFAWLVDEHLSCRAIAIRLMESNISSPTGKNKWAPSVVNHMLKQELYCGTMYFNRREPIKPKKRKGTGPSRGNLKTSRKLRPKEEWIAIPVPPIISREVWEQAQQQLAANARFSPRNNRRRTYLLRGLVRCDLCGKAYVGATIKRRSKEYQYYVCNQAHPEPGDEKCSAPYVPLKLLEDLVWSGI